MAHQIDKKSVLVTGGGSGIGLAIATAFADADYRVTIAGRNSQKLKATGLAYVEMDVTDEASVFAGVKAAGPVDIMIANAGAAETAPALKTERDLWDRMLLTNLTSVYISARATAPAMVERGWGRFIAIASTASLIGYPYTGAYAAAKHGVLGWIKTLAIELAKTNVTANAICPGFTDTPLVDNALDAVSSKTGRSRREALSEFVKANPMGRLVRPSEVAAAALWLASDSAASVNGQAISIDGGEVVS